MLPLQPIVDTLDDSSLVEEARRIADEILAHRVSVSDGSPNWLGPTGYGTALHPVQQDKLGPHLYNGTTGVALFLAALARLTGERRYADLGLEVLAPLCRRLHELAEDSERAARAPLSVGGLIGIGSLVFGLLAIGELLDDPALVCAAHRSTVLLTEERIARDDRVRIQTGCAGAVLALLALHRRQSEPNAAGETPLDLARRCADRILAARAGPADPSDHPRAWPLSPGKPPLAGFSYGAAGIAYALFRLFEETGEEPLRQAAEEGMAFVRSLYVPERRSWRDARVLFQARFHPPALGTWKDWWATERHDGDLVPRVVPEVPPLRDSDFQTTWCHGACGIALGMLAVSHLISDPRARLESVDALHATALFARSERFAEVVADDLCCGHAGRIEVLHTAALQLADPGLGEAARELAFRILQRARRRGRYELSAARGSELFAPSLFQGAAGVGYTFLRLASADHLPSLLLLS
jgi:lantibiotic modifying enzyme